MRIAPELRALRSNPAPQRLAQTVLEQAKADWRRCSDNTQIFAELARFGAGNALSDCPALDRAISCAEGASRFVGILVAALVYNLARHPIGQIPFRHQYSGGMAVLQLAAAGQAALSLVMYERAAGAAGPQTICFTDSERREIALAGSGQVTMVERLHRSDCQAELRARSVDIAAGVSLALDGMFQTKFVSRVENRLVVLRLSRTAAAPQPSLEFRLSDGVLVHRASGTSAIAVRK